ncbi:hypothetical protein KIN20_020328 [Parelaphostrongylus tenuis]|uniref:Uncharacterized protein n=1 Tax=Parelaphostrongylus tenuis TaxID=148309 RepID=A0AAD5MM97_PARTN|nr:hypothetical protein KIN20_020328 [Parelaphostrongylus tenuis]
MVAHSYELLKQIFSRSSCFFSGVSKWPKSSLTQVATNQTVAGYRETKGKLEKRSLLSKKHFLENCNSHENIGFSHSKGWDFATMPQIPVSLATIS